MKAMLMLSPCFTDLQGTAKHLEIQQSTNKGKEEKNCLLVNMDGKQLRIKMLIKIVFAYFFPKEGYNRHVCFTPCTVSFGWHQCLQT